MIIDWSDTDCRIELEDAERILVEATAGAGLSLAALGAACNFLAKMAVLFSFRDIRQGCKHTWHGYTWYSFGSIFPRKTMTGEKIEFVDKGGQNED